MFICFEGIDGAGKTTQARMLHQRLCAEGLSPELVHDPGTTKIGTAIRQILLHNDAPISAHAQMLLFSAARAELAVHIRAVLDAGGHAICDRWLLSTLVYQGEINGISEKLITTIFQETSRVEPDLCFLLDLDPEDAGARMTKRSGSQKMDRYERRCVSDRIRMRDAYLRYADEPPHNKNMYVVSAAESPEETHELVYDAVMTVFSRMESKNDNGRKRLLEKS